MVSFYSPQNEHLKWWFDGGCKICALSGAAITSESCRQWIPAEWIVSGADSCVLCCFLFKYSKNIFAAVPLFTVNGFMAMILCFVFHFAS